MTSSFKPVKTATQTSLTECFKRINNSAVKRTKPDNNNAMDVASSPKRSRKSTPIKITNPLPITKHQFLAAASVKPPPSVFVRSTSSESKLINKTTSLCDDDDGGAISFENLRFPPDLSNNQSQSPTRHQQNLLQSDSNLTCEANNSCSKTNPVCIVLPVQRTASSTTPSSSSQMTNEPKLPVKMQVSPALNKSALRLPKHVPRYPKDDSFQTVDATSNEAESDHISRKSFSVVRMVDTDLLELVNTHDESDILNSTELPMKRRDGSKESDSGFSEQSTSSKMCRQFQCDADNEKQINSVSDCGLEASDSDGSDYNIQSSNVESSKLLPDDSNSNSILCCSDTQSLGDNNSVTMEHHDTSLCDTADQEIVCVDSVQIDLDHDSNIEIVSKSVEEESEHISSTSNDYVNIELQLDMETEDDVIQNIPDTSSTAVAVQSTNSYMSNKSRAELRSLFKNVYSNGAAEKILQFVEGSRETVKKKCVTAAQQSGSLKQQKLRVVNKRSAPTTMLITSDVEVTGTPTDVAGRRERIRLAMRDSYAHRVPSNVIDGCTDRPIVRSKSSKAKMVVEDFVDEAEQAAAIEKLLRLRDRKTRLMAMMKDALVSVADIGPGSMDGMMEGQKKITPLPNMAFVRSEAAMQCQLARDMYSFMQGIQQCHELNPSTRHTRNMRANDLSHYKCMERAGAYQMPYGGKHPHRQQPTFPKAATFATRFAWDSELIPKKFNSFDELREVAGFGSKLMLHSNISNDQPAPKKRRYNANSRKSGGTGNSKRNKNKSIL